jgi:hypothetical protein
VCVHAQVPMAHQEDRCGSLAFLKVSSIDFLFAFPPACTTALSKLNHLYLTIQTTLLYKYFTYKLQEWFGLIYYLLVLQTILSLNTGNTIIKTNKNHTQNSCSSETRTLIEKAQLKNE